MPRVGSHTTSLRTINTRAGIAHVSHVHACPARRSNSSSPTTATRPRTCSVRCAGSPKSTASDAAAPTSSAPPGTKARACDGASPLRGASPVSLPNGGAHPVAVVLAQPARRPGGNLGDCDHGHRGCHIRVCPWAPAFDRWGRGPSSWCRFAARGRQPVHWRDAHPVRGGCAPAHLRHHQPPRRGQDHPHREVPPLRRGGAVGRRGEGSRRASPGDVRLDGDGAEARHLHHLHGAAVPLPRLAC